MLLFGSRKNRDAEKAGWGYLKWLTPEAVLCMINSTWRKEYICPTIAIERSVITERSRLGMEKAVQEQMAD